MQNLKLVQPLLCAITHTSVKTDSFQITLTPELLQDLSEFLKLRFIAKAVGRIREGVDQNPHRTLWNAFWVYLPVLCSADKRSNQGSSLELPVIPLCLALLQPLGCLLLFGSRAEHPHQVD